MKRNFECDLLAHLPPEQRAELLPITDGSMGKDDKIPF
jgi:hypothetical protein